MSRLAGLSVREALLLTPGEAGDLFQALAKQKED